MEWKGLHILRCEKRRKIDLPQQFGRTVTAGLLADPDFFRENVLDWQSTIATIEHTRIVTLSDAYANATPGKRPC